MSRFAVLLVVILAIPSVALASSVMRTGETVSVAANQAVEGDFYGLGSTVTISGEITEDLLIIGGKVKINGSTGSDLAVLAGDVQIDGVVGDDARIVAGEVTVAGEILGDLVVLAGTLNVLSTAKVNGDILFFGTDAVISGEVGKSIFGTSDRLRVEGIVRGDIDIKVGTLTLGERADVTGMVKYTSANDLVRAQDARVAGQVVRNQPTLQSATFKDVVVPLLVFLFAALVWFLLFGRLLERVSTQVAVHPLRSVLIGFGLFFLIPIAVGILIVSQLGSLLGLMLLFAYLALVLAAVTISGVVLGSYLFTLMSQKNAIGIPSVIFGTSVVFLLLFIPVIGPVAFVCLVLTTMGALATHLYRTIRFS